MSSDKIDCFRCQHFFITWDPNFPRGCRVLGFKGREMPSSVVRGSSGAECLYFTPKRTEGGRGASPGSESRSK